MNYRFWGLCIIWPSELYTRESPALVAVLGLECEVIDSEAALFLKLDPAAPVAKRLIARIASADQLHAKLSIGFSCARVIE